MKYIFYFLVPSVICAILSMIADKGCLSSAVSCIICLFFTTFWVLIITGIDAIYETLHEVWKVSYRLDDIEKKLKEFSEKELEK
jgi:hypothetical protein